MKKINLVFVLALLAGACKKEEKITIDTSPKELNYDILDSTYAYYGYTVGPDGVYKQDDYKLSFPVAYQETVTIDTFSDIKQLTYRGVSFPRDKNAVNRFSKSGPKPLPGNYISITLRNDSILVSCEIDRRQTWQKNYSLRGKLK